ncbi:MAG: hypothetical protein J5486_04650 [Bacteroidaceae bacterium]|nr:hypothetical protein [Bacteroidaceae bacterium]
MGTSLFCRRIIHYLLTSQLFPAVVSSVICRHTDIWERRQAACNQTGLRLNLYLPTKKCVCQHFSETYT